jgi:flagellar biosynthesis GTPase FlhF
VVNAYAVEIGDALWSAIYDYLWMNRRGDEFSVDGIYEDGDQKFAILRDRKNLTYYRLNFSLSEENGFVPEGELEQVAPDFKPTGEAQFSLEAVEAFEVEYVKSKKAKEEEDKKEAENDSKEEEPKEDSESKEDEKKEDNEEKSDDDDSKEEKKEDASEEESEEEKKKKEKKAKYNLEEVVEYTELLNKYNELEGKVSELTAQIDTLTAENKTLTEFKLEIDRKNKLALINETFYMLSDD